MYGVGFRPRCACDACMLASLYSVSTHRPCWKPRAVYKAMKGVETVAVKVCSAMVGKADKARRRTIRMLPRACCARRNLHGRWVLLSQGFE